VTDWITFYPKRVIQNPQGWGFDDLRVAVCKLPDLLRAWLLQADRPIDPGV
jgi:hypothetical protein